MKLFIDESLTKQAEVSAAQWESWPQARWAIVESLLLKLPSPTTPVWGMLLGYNQY